MEKILTRNIGVPDSQDIDIYVKNGGYGALERALSLEPEAIIEEIRKSGLVGRGGAAFPVHLKWSFTRMENASPKFIVANGDEGEPGTFKDRAILKNDPHLLIEGLIIAGYAIGARYGAVYIRGEYFKEIETIQGAIDQARTRGFLGDNILGSGFSFDIQLYRGAGAYVCGAASALLESMEGKRGNSRCKPPHLAEIGFLNKPTAVNNVETLSNVPFIINRGGDFYSNIGCTNCPGTKLFSLSGHVNRPGLYELPTGTSLRELIEIHGGGVEGRFKAVLPGGVSSCLLTDLDVPLDYKSIAQAGSMLATASVIVINQTANMVDVAKNTMDFFVEESCGKCTPCREGTKIAKDILDRFAEGKGKASELDTLQELGELMAATSVCGLGQAAMNATISGIRLFREDFEERMA